MLYHPGLKLFVGPPWRVFWLLLTSPLGKKSVRVWVLRKYAAPYLGSKPKLMYAQYSCIDFPRLRFTSRKTYLPAQAKHPFLNYMPTPPDTPLWVKIYDPLNVQILRPQAVKISLHTYVIDQKSLLLGMLKWTGRRKRGPSERGWKKRPGSRGKKRASPGLKRSVNFLGFMFSCCR